MFSCQICGQAVDTVTTHSCYGSQAWPLSDRSNSFNTDQITNDERLVKIETELQNLKLATYDLLQAIQRIETNQQKLLFKKEIK